MSSATYLSRRLFIANLNGWSSSSFKDGCGSIRYFEEIDVDLKAAATADEVLLHRLCEWVGEAAVACRATLRSLRLSGPLHLGVIFQTIAPFAQQFLQLEAVCLARGSIDWQPAVAACVLHQLPALQRLQFRFSFDDDDTPQNLLSLLLLPQSAAAVAVAGAGGAAALAPGLPQLRHLALIFPPRSVAPPVAPLPDELSTLTQLSALKLKRYPVTEVPTFLGALTQLRFLLWDPALPADVAYAMPPGLAELTRLEFLWVVCQFPLALPSSLAGSLQGLHTMVRGYREDIAEEQRWDWLQPFTNLRSLRLQGLGMVELPQELTDKSQLTRLDLMVNHLQDVPPGPYLHDLQYIHLGNNRLARFPSALLAAKQLVAVYLANQRSSGSSGGGSSGGASPSSTSSATSSSYNSMGCGPGFTRRLELTAADVEGLLGLPHLETVVMSNLQPVVHVGAAAPLQDFTWLQRLLKQRRDVRLTSNELAYPLQSKQVFDIPPLLAGSSSNCGSSSFGGAGVGGSGGAEPPMPQPHGSI